MSTGSSESACATTLGRSMAFSRSIVRRALKEAGLALISSTTTSDVKSDDGTTGKKAPQLLIDSLLLSCAYARLVATCRSRGLARAEDKFGDDGEPSTTETTEAAHLSYSSLQSRFAAEPIPTCTRVVSMLSFASSVWKKKDVAGIVSEVTEGPVVDGALPSPSLYNLAAASLEDARCVDGCGCNANPLFGRSFTNAFFSPLLRSSAGASPTALAAADENESAYVCGLEALSPGELQWVWSAYAPAMRRQGLSHSLSASASETNASNIFSANGPAASAEKALAKSEGPADALGGNSAVVCVPALAAVVISEGLAAMLSLVADRAAAVAAMSENASSPAGLTLPMPEDAGIVGGSVHVASLSSVAAGTDGCASATEHGHAASSLPQLAIVCGGDEDEDADDGPSLPPLFSPVAASTTIGAPAVAAGVERGPVKCPDAPSTVFHAAEVAGGSLPWQDNPFVAAVLQRMGLSPADFGAVADQSHGADGEVGGGNDTFCSGGLSTTDVCALIAAVVLFPFPPSPCPPFPSDPSPSGNDGLVAAEATKVEVKCEEGGAEEEKNEAAQRPVHRPIVPSFFDVLTSELSNKKDEKDLAAAEKSARWAVKKEDKKKAKEEKRAKKEKDAKKEKKEKEKKKSAKKEKESKAADTRGDAAADDSEDEPLLSAFPLLSPSTTGVGLTSAGSGGEADGDDGAVAVVAAGAAVGSSAIVAVADTSAVAPDAGDEAGGEGGSIGLPATSVGIGAKRGRGDDDEMMDEEAPLSSFAVSLDGGEEASPTEAEAAASASAYTLPPPADTAAPASAKADTKKKKEATSTPAAKKGSAKAKTRPTPSASEPTEPTTVVEAAVVASSSSASAAVRAPLFFPAKSTAAKTAVFVDLLDSDDDESDGDGNHCAALGANTANAYVGHLDGTSAASLLAEEGLATADDIPLLMRSDPKALPWAIVEAYRTPLESEAVRMVVVAEEEGDEGGNGNDKKEDSSAVPFVIGKEEGRDLPSPLPTQTLSDVTHHFTLKELQQYFTETVRRPAVVSAVEAARAAAKERAREEQAKAAAEAFVIASQSLTPPPKQMTVADTMKANGGSAGEEVGAAVIHSLLTQQPLADTVAAVSAVAAADFTDLAATPPPPPTPAAAKRLLIGGGKRSRSNSNSCADDSGTGGGASPLPPPKRPASQLQQRPMTVAAAFALPRLQALSLGELVLEQYAPLLTARGATAAGGRGGGRRVAQRGGKSATKKGTAEIGDGADADDAPLPPMPSLPNVKAHMAALVFALKEKLLHACSLPAA